MGGLLGKLSSKGSADDAAARRRGAAQALRSAVPGAAPRPTDIREHPQPMGNPTVIMSSNQMKVDVGVAGEVPVAVRVPGVESRGLREPLPQARWSQVPLEVQPRVLAVLREVRREFAVAQVEAAQDNISVAERGRSVFERVKGRHADLKSEELELASWIFDGMVMGYGPLKPLLDDTHVTEIYIDSSERIRCLRGGEFLQTPFAFVDEQDFQQFIERLLTLAKLDVAPVGEQRGAEIGFSVPDMWKTRVHLRRPPGGNLSNARLVLHLTRMENPSLYELTRTGMLPSGMSALLREFVDQSLGHLLIAGPRASGKSTLMKVLLAPLVERERVLVVEGDGEMALSFPQVESIRVPSEAVDLGQLAAQHAAQRIVVAEVSERSGAMLVQAVEAGYPGVICALHAASGKAALWKLVDSLSHSTRVGPEQIISRISAAVSMIAVTDVVHGVPMLKEIVEVLPSDGVEFSTRTLLRLELNPDGSMDWRMQTNQSLLVRKMRERGIQIGDLGPGAAAAAPVDRRPVTP